MRRNFWRCTSSATAILLVHQLHKHDMKHTPTYSATGYICSLSFCVNRWRLVSMNQPTFSVVHYAGQKCLVANVYTKLYHNEHSRFEFIHECNNPVVSSLILVWNLQNNGKHVYMANPVWARCSRSTDAVHISSYDI